MASINLNFDTLGHWALQPILCLQSSLLCFLCLLRTDTTPASSSMEQSEMRAQSDADRVEILTSRVKTLLDLPPEIILRIAAFLPTTSTASFALCNKRSAAQLGSRAWNLLSGQNPRIVYTSFPFYHEISLATMHAMGVSAFISAVLPHSRQTSMHHPSPARASRRLLTAVIQKMGLSLSRTIFLFTDCASLTSN